MVMHLEYAEMSLCLLTKRMIFWFSTQLGQPSFGNDCVISVTVANGFKNFYKLYKQVFHTFNTVLIKLSTYYKYSIKSVTKLFVQILKNSFKTNIIFKIILLNTVLQYCMLRFCDKLNNSIGNQQFWRIFYQGFWHLRLPTVLYCRLQSRPVMDAAGASGRAAAVVVDSAPSTSAYPRIATSRARGRSGGAAKQQ